MEQSLLATLSQHAEGIAMAGVVEGYAVHTQETVTRTQGALSGGWGRRREEEGEGGMKDTRETRREREEVERGGEGREEKGDERW